MHDKHENDTIHLGNEKQNDWRQCRHEEVAFSLENISSSEYL